MIGSIVKSLFGVLLIPIAIGATKAFYDRFVCITEFAKSLNIFLYGITSYVVLHILIYKPTYMYVLGHETVHAMTAWLFGKKIKSIKVSEDGGSVSTNGSNVFIELSPYFIPVYLIAILIVYFVISASYTVNSATFVYLMGFALSFHVIMTIEVLKIRQPDIVKSGYIFSIALIYSLNIVVISLIFGLLFPQFALKSYFLDLYNNSRTIYIAVFRQLFL